MKFDAFVSILIENGMDIYVSKAQKLYAAMDFDGQQATIDSLQNCVDQLRASASVPADASRVLTEFGVQLALRTDSVLNFISIGNRIAAIKELRRLARHEWGIPMVLIHARDAVSDSRVIEQAAIPEWERDLLGGGWDKPLINTD